MYCLESLTSNDACVSTDGRHRRRIIAGGAVGLGATTGQDLHGSGTEVGREDAHIVSRGRAGEVSRVLTRLGEVEARILGVRLLVAVRAVGANAADDGFVAAQPVVLGAVVDRVGVGASVSGLIELVHVVLLGAAFC